MKGFKIICKTEEGRKAVLSKNNKNKKAFHIITESEEPLIIRYENKKLLRIDEDDLIYIVKKALKKAGATIKQDYEIEVLN